ncbi:hypothetical protein GCM10028816_52890 [Spirosoma lituiforme]
MHVIVSRFKEREMEQPGCRPQRSMSLFPLINHRQAGGAICNGFDRVNFIQANENHFDQQFGYKRELTETFAHAKSIHSEHQPDRLAAREKQIKDQIQQNRLHT